MASRKSVAGSSLRRAETVLGGLDVSTGELDCSAFLLHITYNLSILGK